MQKLALFREQDHDIKEIDMLILVSKMMTIYQQPHSTQPLDLVM